MKKAVTFNFTNKFTNPVMAITDAFAFAQSIHKLAKQAPAGATGAIWLRGQPDGSWSLVPSIGRTDAQWVGRHLRRSKAIAKEEAKEVIRMEEVEYNLLHRFRLHAHAFLKREPTRWEAISMARHYGLPTRLLDWSSNPLVALYFACESHESCDGAIFAFRPSRSWASHVNVYDDGHPDHKHISNPLDVVGVRLVYPMMSSERLIAQSGGFTLQSPWIPLDAQAGRRFDRGELEIFELFKWRIPKGAKPGIVDQLHRAGINHRSLFPDLGGVAVNLLRGELLRERPGSKHWRNS